MIVQNTQTSENSAAEARMLKMKELSEATGVSGGTIRYYIQEGLLPKPMKTHRNMAYYDESYVEKIKTIKELQQKRYLPLNVIKTIIEDIDESELMLARTRIETEMPGFTDVLFTDALNGEDIQPMNMEDLSAFSGMSIQDLHEVSKLGIFEPDENGLFDRECAQMAKVAAEFRQIGLTDDAGFGIDSLMIYVDLLDFISRKEVRMFSSRLAAINLTPDGLIEIIRKAMEIINQLFPILHRRMLRKISRELE